MSNYEMLIRFRNDGSCEIDLLQKLNSRDELLKALKLAHNGLLWYRDMRPTSVDASDDEADEVILTAIAKAEGRSCP